MSVERSFSNGPSSHGVLTSAAGARPFDDGQRVAGRGDDDQPVAQERLGDHRRHVLAVGHRRAERDVDAAVGQQRGEVLAPRDLQLDLDVVVAMAEDAQQRAGGELGERRRRRDAQRRLLAVGRRGSRAAPPPRGRGCSLAALASRRPPGVSSMTPPARTYSWIAELAAQGSDRAGYRRLGDLQRARRGLDGAQPGDRQEAPKLREGQLSDRFIWVADAIVACIGSPPDHFRRRGASHLGNADPRALRVLAGHERRRRHSAA